VSNELAFAHGVLLGILLGFTLSYALIPAMVDGWYWLVRRISERRRAK